MNNENSIENKSKEDQLDITLLLQQKDEEIRLLKQNIKYRDITLSLYKSLIEGKLGIKLDTNIFDDDITIYSNFKVNYTRGKTKEKNKNNPKAVVEKPFVNTLKKSAKAVKKTQKINVPIDKKPKKPTNKPIIVKKKQQIPKSIQFTKERTDEETQSFIDGINQKISDKSPSKFWLLSKQEHLNNIENLIESLENTRSYSKVLSDIKLHRFHLFKYLNESEYSKHVYSQTEKIKKIFKTRGKDDKQIKALVRHKIIGAYEHRMLFLDEFEKTTIEIDEVELIKKCLDEKFKRKINFEKFSLSTLTDNICNYHLCITDVLSVISSTITNIYGFHNVVYLSFDDNDFAFYTLENITKNSRKWNMDCQLDDISNEVWDKIFNYLTSIFKKIYQKVYHDNQYRSDFIEVSQVMELEGIQILKNLIYLSDKPQFVKDFKNIVKSSNNYVPTEIDSFNLFTNDPLLKVNHKKLNINNIFSDIFDNISPNQIKELRSLIQK